jgi:hypothetical protein
MRDARIDETKNARHRTLRAAAETERLEKLGEGVLVLRSTVYYDDVGFGVAKGLSGLDERARIGGSDACHDFRAGGECEMSDGATRCLFATVNERDAKWSTQRDTGLLDGDPYPDRGPYPSGFDPGRDRHRDAVVVRAASWTKASNTPSTPGDIPWSFPIRSGCH